MEIHAGRDSVPLLDAHNRYDVASVKGRVYGFNTENRETSATVFFSETARDEFTKVQEKSITDLSIGYHTYRDHTIVVPTDSKYVINGEERTNDTGRTLMVRTKFTIKEVSLVPIGADSDATFRNDQEPQTEGESMNEEQMRAKIEADIRAAAEREKKEAEEQARKEGVQLERERQEEIRALVNAVDLDDDVRSELSASFIASGKSIDEARKEVIAKVSETRAHVKPAAVAVQKDGVDKARQFAEDVFAVRSGLADEKQIDRVSKSGENVSIQGVCRNYLAARGENVSNANPETLFRKSMDAFYERASGVSTGSLGNILLDAKNKMIAASFDRTATTWDRWCGVGSAQDFKTINMVKRSMLLRAPNRRVALNRRV
jgi:hypothetical protein